MTTNKGGNNINCSDSSSDGLVEDNKVEIFTSPPNPSSLISGTIPQLSNTESILQKRKKKINVFGIGMEYSTKEDETISDNLRRDLTSFHQKLVALFGHPFPFVNGIYDRTSLDSFSSSTSSSSSFSSNNSSSIENILSSQIEANLSAESKNGVSNQPLPRDFTVPNRTSFSQHQPWKKKKIRSQVKFSFFFFNFNF